MHIYLVEQSSILLSTQNKTIYQCLQICIYAYLSITFYQISLIWMLRLYIYNYFNNLLIL
jgi:hypothetical protein